jgi:hypothetical protein
MRNLIIIFTMILVCSCNNTKRQTAQTTQPENSLFKIFIKKFQPVDLPFTYRYTIEGLTIDFKKLQKLDSNSSDTLFLKPESPDETYCYRMLRDTTKFYSLIFLFPADEYYPVLVTYTKTGKQISQTNLIAVGCGLDCGLTYYSVTGRINNDMTILCADTAKYKFMCDSLSNEIPNSGKKIINLKTGRVSNNGKIMVNPIRRFEQKN